MPEHSNSATPRHSRPRPHRSIPDRGRTEAFATAAAPKHSHAQRCRFNQRLAEQKGNGTEPRSRGTPRRLVRFARLSHARRPSSAARHPRRALSRTRRPPRQPGSPPVSRTRVAALSGIRPRALAHRTSAAPVIAAPASTSAAAACIVVASLPRGPTARCLAAAVSRCRRPPASVRAGPALRRPRGGLPMLRACPGRARGDPSS